MDRGAWWATIRRVTKSWMRLKQLSTHIKVTTIFICPVNFKFNIPPENYVEDSSDFTYPQWNIQMRCHPHGCSHPTLGTFHSPSPPTPNFLHAP